MFITTNSLFSRNDSRDKRINVYFCRRTKFTEYGNRHRTTGKIGSGKFSCRLQLRAIGNIGVPRSSVARQRDGRRIVIGFRRRNRPHARGLRSRQRDGLCRRNDFACDRPVEYGGEKGELRPHSEIRSGIPSRKREHSMSRAARFGAEARCIGRANVIRIGFGGRISKQRRTGVADAVGTHGRILPQAPLRRVCRDGGTHNRRIYSGTLKHARHKPRLKRRRETVFRKRQSHNIRREAAALSSPRRGVGRQSPVRDNAERGREIKRKQRSDRER